MTFNPQRAARKSPRLQGYDYSQAGAYFVTICAHNRVCLFGEVVDGKMRLSDAGQAAQACWEAIPAHFPHVELDVFVVMPNHVHGIVILGENPRAQVVGTRHASSLHHTAPANGRPIGVKKGSLGAIVGSYKSAVTNRVNRILYLEIIRVWQRSFHDHIIRSERELKTLREYVLYNPARWEADRYYG